mgnify:CR=1 FL=1
MPTSDRTLEVTGYIKKQETLSTIENQILANTWVLESLHPFPGYHGNNLPDESDPRSLFLMVQNGHSFEDVARMSKSIKANFSHGFNASEGLIYFKPYTYHCIRLKYLSSFSYIPDLQEMFSGHGVKYMKQREMEKEAIIKINKTFWVEEQEEGIYRDMNNQVKCYVEVPEQMDWEGFKQFTFNIKNNLVDNNFDAAQGVFFRKKGIVDVVRIYDRDRSLEKMRLLKNMYQEQVRKSYK